MNDIESTAPSGPVREAPPAGPQAASPAQAGRPLAGDHGTARGSDAAAEPAGDAVPDAAQLKRIVEAALLAAHQPLGLKQLAGLFPDDGVPTSEQLREALSALATDCDGRGVELVEVASGFRYQVRRDVHAWVSRLWAERPARYGRAVLETLALIAYRQPITRGEIEQIRGVAVSTQIVRTLEEREWIRVVGHRDVPGKPALYGTTREFLDHFGLRSLDQLPPLAELRDIPELEPELPFGGAPPSAAHADVAGEAAAAPTPDSDADADSNADTDPDAHAEARRREDGAPEGGQASTTVGEAMAGVDANPDSSPDVADDAEGAADEAHRHHGQESR